MSDNLVFGVGTMIATVGGQDIEFGELQNVSVDLTMARKYLRGGSSKVAKKGRVTQKEIKCKAQYAKIIAEGLKVALGGTITTAGGRKKLLITGSDVPTTFKVVLKNPGDGSEIAITLFACESEKLGLGLVLDDFSMPDFEFSAIEDADGKWIEFDLPAGA